MFTKMYFYQQGLKCFSMSVKFMLDLKMILPLNLDCKFVLGEWAKDICPFSYKQNESLVIAFCKIF